MTIEQLQAEMVAAMKSKNSTKKNVISNIISTAKNIAIEEKSKDNVTEEIVAKAIKKVQKISQDQFDTCPPDRQELFNQYQAELNYVNEYAPQMMNEEETRKAIYNIIATVDIQQTGKGAIMKAVMPKLKGKADGKIISKIVDEIVAKTGE